MLEQLQSQFMAAIRGAPPELVLASGAIRCGQSWAVYRCNYLEGHIAALADTYGSVVKLVGHDYFRQLARHYVQQGESRSGDLNDYGADFAEFLQALLPNVPGGSDLPYLPDVASLDWVCFAQLRAAPPSINCLAQLLQSPPHTWPRIRVQASGVCLSSAYPLYRIWQLAAGASENLCLSEGGQAVLISRPQQVEVTLLSAAQAHFCLCWFAGQSLEYALAAALTLEADFDLSAILHILASQAAIHTIRQ